MNNQPTEKFLNYIENRWQTRNSWVPLPKGKSAKIWLLGVEEGANFEKHVKEIEGSNSMGDAVYNDEEAYRKDVDGAMGMHHYGKRLWCLYRGFVGKDDLEHKDFVDTMRKQYLMMGNLYPIPLPSGNDDADELLWHKNGLHDKTGFDSVKAYKEHMDQRDDYRKLAADTVPQLIVCNGINEGNSFARRFGVCLKDMNHKKMKVKGKNRRYYHGTINDGETMLCITYHLTYRGDIYAYLSAVGQDLHEIYNN